MKHTALFVVLAGLAACGAIVPRTALMLNAINPLTADPEALSVAVEFPEGLGLLPDGVSISVEGTNPRRGERAGAWILTPEDDAEGRVTYRFGADQAAELRIIQAELAKWKAEDPNGTTGSFSVFVKPCRSVPAEALSGAEGSLFIGVDPSRPPRPLFRNAPISDIADGATLESLPICAAEAG